MHMRVSRICALRPCASRPDAPALDLRAMRMHMCAYDMRTPSLLCRGHELSMSLYMLMYLHVHSVDKANAWRKYQPSYALCALHALALYV